MTEFMRPTVTTEEVNDTVARYIVEPLERGYGHTLGNSLRRVLLSSLDGAKATAIHLHHAASHLDHIGFLDVEGVQFGHHAGGDTRSRQRNVRLGRVVEKLGDVATLRRRELPKASARDEEWMGHDGLA